MEFDLRKKLKELHQEDTSRYITEEVNSFFAAAVIKWKIPTNPALVAQKESMIRIMTELAVEQKVNEVMQRFANQVEEMVNAHRLSKALPPTTPETPSPQGGQNE